MNKNLLLFLISGIYLLGIVEVAYSTSVYSDQATFLASSGPVVTEDFESYAAGNPDSGAVSAMVLTDFTVNSTPAAIKILDNPWYGNHNTTPGGSQYLSFDTDIGGVGSDATLTFNSPIYSFGLYLIDLEEDLIININSVNYNIGANGNGGETYFGIISDVAFTSVFLDGGLTDSHSSIDDVSYSSTAPVPEPATMFLLGTGLVGVSGAARRKKRNQG